MVRKVIQKNKKIGLGKSVPIWRQWKWHFVPNTMRKSIPLKRENKTKGVTMIMMTE